MQGAAQAYDAQIGSDLVKVHCGSRLEPLKSYRARMAGHLRDGLRRINPKISIGVGLKERRHELEIS